MMILIANVMMTRLNTDDDLKFFFEEKILKIRTFLQQTHEISLHPHTQP